MSTTMTFDIVARDRASDKFDKFGNAVDGSSGKLKKFAKFAAAGLAAGGVIAGKFALDTVKSASDVEQSFGALESVYGKNAKQVKEWASAAADGVGLAKSEYANLSALVGSQLQGMGTSSDKAAKKSNDLIKMGADLAATYGGSVKDAVEAVSSTLKGETDPIERYGVSIKASDVSARKLAMGLDGLTGKADKQATAQATLALLTEQTGKAQGAFGRESDTLAGQQERLGAKFDNLKASLGEKLLPVMTSATTAASDFITELQTGEGTGGKVAAAFKTVGDNLDTIAPVLGVVTAGLVTYATASKAVAIATAIQAAGTAGATGATWSLNAAMRANPIGIVVTALTLLAAGLVVAYKKSETFRNIVNGAFDVVKSAGTTLWDSGLRPAFSKIKDGFEAVGKAGTWLWNKALQPAFKFIINGVGEILDMWSSMLGVLGEVPGFGWAKDAAKAMGNAADKARAVADGIKKIPPSKKVTVTVVYAYQGKRNPGKEGGMDILPRGTIRNAQAAGAELMSMLADGIKKGGKKLDEVLATSRDRIKTAFSGIRDEMSSLSESVASSINQTDFSGGISELMASLTGNGGALSGLTNVFATLKDSVSKGFLSSLMQSGNVGLATSLASDPAAAAAASAQFDANAAMAKGLGDQTAQQVLGDRFEKALADEIKKLLDELKSAPDKHAKKLRRELQDLRLVVEGLSAGRTAHLRGAR